jgi:peptidoglycan/xylan/chitin deacetylase (PgdA/CDA1 family)
MNLITKKRPAVSRCLAYHEVTPSEPSYLYGVSLEKFERQVRRVRDLNLQTVSTGSRSAITFDDGHVSQFENAVPVLEAMSAKATFFVTAGWMGSRAGYMSWEQLSELCEMGHEVQAHGWSHILLTQCSPQALDEELKRSKCELENHLGKKVDALSAPGGRWNRQVLEACVKAGYTRIFTSDPWVVQENRSGLEVLGRWMVTNTLDEHGIENMLEGKGLQIQRAKYLVKEGAKKMFGDTVYQFVWRSLSRKKESLENMGERVNTPRG